MLEKDKQNTHDRKLQEGIKDEQNSKKEERKQTENERDERRGKGGVMVIYGCHAAQISIRRAITNGWSLEVTLGWSRG